MTAARLVLARVALENRAFWRNPAAAFFTVAFPLVFLVVAGSALAGPLGGGIEAARFYTPAIITFALVTACYTNLAMGVVLAREAGVLKRLRGTPLPTWAFVAGRVGQGILVTALMAALIALYGALVHGVAPAAERVPVLFAGIVLGAASASALGLAITSLVPNAAAAPALVNATILPLLLISNVLVPLEDGPLAAVAALFPVRHLADILASAYDPATNLAAGTIVASFVIVAAWGAMGLAVALRTFRWAPRG